MRVRNDGSVQSSSTPTYQNMGRKEDHALYRCMVIKTIFVGDPNNITSMAQNPRVLYDVVVLGGFASGQIISNCRLASALGGNNNYFERTLKASSKQLGKIPLEKHDGDIVFVQFIQGHTGSPVIVALDQGIKTPTDVGAKEADGLVLKWQYNGVGTQIDSKGNLTVLSTGTLDDEGAPENEDVAFTYLHKKGAMINIDKMGSIKVVGADGGYMFMNAEAKEFSIVGAAGNMISLSEEEITIASADGGKMISFNDNLQLTSDKDLVLQSSGNLIFDAGQVALQNLTAKVQVANGQIAIGTPAAELLDLVDQLLDQVVSLTTSMATEVHTGNLGFPTSPPLNAAAYTAVGTSVQAIKLLLLTIKGSL